MRAFVENGAFWGSFCFVCVRCSPVKEWCGFCVGSIGIWKIRIIIIKNFKAINNDKGERRERRKECQVADDWSL